VIGYALEGQYNNSFPLKIADDYDNDNDDGDDEKFN